MFEEVKKCLKKQLYNNSKKIENKNKKKKKFKIDINDLMVKNIKRFRKDMEKENNPIAERDE